MRVEVAGAEVQGMGVAVLEVGGAHRTAAPGGEAEEEGEGEEGTDDAAAFHGGMISRGGREAMMNVATRQAWARVGGNGGG